MNYGFTQISHNSKTGPMPVTITGKSSCPDSCPLKNNGCYAAVGRLNIHWHRLDFKGLDIDGLVAQIKAIRPNKLWRHNQAGDLGKDDGEVVNQAALTKIVKANKGKKGFTYTHLNPRLKQNAKAIKTANDQGFTINMSADSLKEADEFKALNVGPVVSILPSDVKENTTTPAGNKVVICPNYTHGVQCIDCGLCQKADRSVIVGFPAHGIAHKRVTQVFNNA